MIRYCESCRLRNGLKDTRERLGGTCDFCLAPHLMATLHGMPAHLLPRSHAVNDMLDKKRARVP